MRNEGDMKNIFCWIILGIVFIASGIGFAAYEVIYEAPMHRIQIADGVWHETHRIFTDDGWLEVQIIRYDIQSTSEIKLLHNQYLSDRSPLRSMANQHSEIVAAMNGDYFDTNSKSVLGRMIYDGKMLQSEVGESPYYHFTLPAFGRPYISNKSFLPLQISNGQTSDSVDYYNKNYPGYDRILLMDKQFRSTSYGYNEKDGVVCELLIRQGRVVEKRLNGRKYTLLPGDSVIAGYGTNAYALDEKYQIGNAVSITFDPSISDVLLSISGGSRLVNDGAVAPITQGSDARHPRTAMAILQGGRQLLLVTVDGRSATHRGITQTELAQLLVNMGAFQAINLDGGGSTQMMVRQPHQSSLHIANHPSDGWERSIYNGIGIVKKTDPKDQRLKDFTLLPTATEMVIGSSIPLNPVGWNHSFDPISIERRVNYRVEGLQASIRGDRLVPHSAGDGVIVATCQGKTVRQPIHVAKKAVKIHVSPSKLGVGCGERHPLTVLIQSEEGHRVVVDRSSVSYQIYGNVGSIDESLVFTSAEEPANGWITWQYKNLDGDVISKSMAVTVGMHQRIICDFSESVAAFESYPSAVRGSYIELDSEVGYLNFDFYDPHYTRAAYAVFEQPLVLPINTQKLSLNVFGDSGCETWLRAKIVDAVGKEHTVDFSRHIDWEGWQTVVAVLPDSVVGAPKLTKIYAVEVDPDRQYQGYVMMDQLTAYFTGDNDLELPADISLESKVAEGTGDLSLLYTNNAEAITQGPLVINAEVYEHPIYDLMRIDNKGYQMATDDWKKLLRYTALDHQKPLVLVMTDVYYFKDAYEKQLLIDQLISYKKRGNEVIAVFPTDNASYYYYNEQGVAFYKVPDFGEQKNKLMLQWKDGVVTGYKNPLQ